MKKHSIPVETAVSEYLRHLKDGEASIIELCDNELTLAGFFEGKGVEFVEDITKDSPIQYADTIDVEDIRAYKARLKSFSNDERAEHLRRLQCFFDFCVERGYMKKVEVGL